MSSAADPYRVEEARAWLFGKALPLWAGAGLDRTGGGSLETLDFDGRDGGSPFKRTRVQARQAFAFTQAALLGWDQGETAASHCLVYLHERTRRPDGAYVRLTAPDGTVSDGAADAYDMAFVLYALAGRIRAGDRGALAEAHALMDVYDRLLSRGWGQGWHEAEDRLTCLNQNPHMHLLEASLELADAGREQRFAEIAQAVLKLFHERMFDDKRRLFVEFYDLDWRPLPDAPVEPGHLYEWAWLLGRAKTVLGENLLEEAEALWATAQNIGTDAETGLVFDRLEPPGMAPTPTSRSWTQTEALKAHLAMLEHGRTQDAAPIARSMGLLMDRYLDAPLEGGWIDQFDLQWKVLSKDVPASILYHVIVAFSELFRLAPRLEEARA